MADQDPNNCSIDPLVRDYESRLQSLVMWDFESLPGLKSYLDNGQILLNAADPRFIELLRIDIRYRVQRSRPADAEPALAVLIQQFPDLSPALIRDLAVYEWQLRLKAGHEPEIQVFVQKLRIRDDTECGELAELLAQFPVVSASRRETVVAGASGTGRDGRSLWHSLAYWSASRDSNAGLGKNLLLGLTFKIGTASAAQLIGNSILI